MTYRVISTIVTPATGAARDLTDLATVKIALQVKDSSTDAYLKLLISWVSAEIQNFCNRTLVVETLKDEFWPQRDGIAFLIPGGIDNLQVSRWPIAASPAVAVVENGTTLSNGVDFRIDADNGQLIRLDGNLYPRRWPAQPLAVTFAAGYDPMEAPIVDAAMRMIRGRWDARSRDPYLMQENIPGVRDVRYWIPTGPTGNLTPDVQEILSDYRAPILGAA